MLEFSERLYSLLMAPYSFIQIRSYEEDRVLHIVRELAEQLGRTAAEWSPCLDDDAPPCAGLLELLRNLGHLPEGGILVLKDAHPYLKDARVVRMLRELEAPLAEQRKVLIFVSPHLDLPRELIKDVTFLDAPLPGRVELLAVLDTVFTVAADPKLPRERIVAAALGLTLREATRAFYRVRFERDQYQRRQRDSADFDLEAAVISEKRRLIEADRVLEYCELSEQMDDIGGLDALKEWLSERQRAFSSQAVDFGLPTPKGVLLTGVQGCGKSLFAKAVAGFWGVPLLRLDFARLFDGSTAPEAAMQRAIETAEAMSPAVLWTDEIDKAFGDSAGGAESRLMGRLLSWLQDKTKPVFFVATANRVDRLPPELLRKGRFDEVFFVDLPGDNERMDILRIHLTRRGRDPDNFDLPDLVKPTRLFSGAELEQVVVSGLYKAFARDRDLTQIDLETAAQEIIPLYRTYEDDIKALRQWAESRARPATRDKTLLDLFRSR